MYGLVFIILWGISQIILFFVSCIPLAAFWDHSIQGKCIDFLVSWYVSGVMNMITDIAIFCIPLPLIKSLQLRRRQKIMLFGVFGLGFLRVSTFTVSYCLPLMLGY